MTDVIDENVRKYGVHHPSVPVIRRPEYVVLLEQFDKYTFIHMDVFKQWTAGIKAKFVRDLNTLMSLHGGPLHVLVAKSNKKLRKFALQFGFEHGMDLTTKDGVESEVLVRRK